MASSKRARKGNQQRRRPGPPAADPHVRVALNSIGAMLEVQQDLLGASDPVAQADERIAGVLGELTTAFAAAEPARIIEIARMRCLPWAHLPVEARSDGGPTRAELIALLALVALQEVPSPGPALERASVVGGTAEMPRPAAAPGGLGSADSSDVDEVEMQPLTNLVYESIEAVDLLLQLAQVRGVLAHDVNDKLAFIAAKMRGVEVWMRNTSYPDRVEITVRELFGGPDVSAALTAGLGFDVDVALRVLKACHQLQVDAMTDRMVTWRDKTQETMRAHPDGLTAGQRDRARREWNSYWDPETDEVTVTAPQLAAATSLTRREVEDVLNTFKFDPSGWAPSELLDAYTSGNNPLRTNPVIDAGGGRFMLVHDAHVLIAVRENLEQYLKGSAAWNQYQTFRGKVLETRTRTAFERVFPEARSWHGFEYYVPVDAGEGCGPADKYTKRVEGDHLFVVDDVALIVEDKAVAVSPLTRAGETRKIRSDLTRIVEKAVEQAARLEDRIVDDRGIRLHDSGWLDLSHVREIHTVAVSLDDLPAAATATAELVAAGFIDPAHISWTVSLHDLDLITELVDHPGEFVLYLRRRTDPLATVMYTAPDELDLFLHFFRSGLYVEPDPGAVRSAFPHLPPPTTAELRRFRRQRPVYIASLTDDLDNWHRARISERVDSAEIAGVAVGAPGSGTANRGAPAAPAKPSMRTSALQGLLDELRQRRTFGWLSISATLLANATPAQERMARIPLDLLRSPLNNGRGRSLAIPIVDPHGDGWLLTWMTRPSSRDPRDVVDEARTYLQAKKYQLGLPRAAAFIYDEVTGALAEVVYDADRGNLSEEAQALLNELRPPTAMTSLPPPKAKRPANSVTDQASRIAKKKRGSRRRGGRR